MRSLSPTVRHQLAILAMASIVLFTNLGGPRLWDRDEPRNAGCAAEMMSRGDWVVPVFNAELRQAKPVLLYWFIMSAYGLFGVNEFAARFWSAAFSVGTVLVTYHIGRRLFNASAALWGALILSTTLMFGIAGRAATPDALLIFFGTSSLLVFVLGTFRPKAELAGAGITPPELRTPGQFFPSDWRYVISMYGLMGVAILAKGPVGLVLPTAVMGMFLLIKRLPARPEPQPAATGRRQRLERFARFVLRPFAPGHFARTCWSMRLLTATAVALLIALPWYALVGWRTDGQWLRGFFLDENFGRAFRPMENHGGPPFYYPGAVLIGFLPWSIILVPALIESVRRVRRGDPWSTGYIFLQCWAGVYMVLFTLARTKLPSYVTPTYPAFALLAGGFMYRWIEGSSLTSPRWLRGGLGVWIALGPLALVGIFVAARHWLPGDEWLGAFCLVLTLGGAACLYLLNQGKRRSVAVAMAGTAVVFSTVLFGFASLRVDRHQQNHVLLATIAQHSTRPNVGALGALEPSLVFYGQRPIAKLVRKRPDKPAGRRQGHRTWSPQGTPQERIDVATFLAGDSQAFVITTDRYFREIAPQLPNGVKVLVDVPYFMKKHRLVLLGHERPTWTAEARPVSAVKR